MRSSSALRLAAALASNAWGGGIFNKKRGEMGQQSGRTSSFFSFSASSLMSLSRSSLTFLSLILVSDRKPTLFKESMNGNKALRRGIVSAA